MADTSDIAALSFEQALAELEKIVGELESGQAPLEKSIEIYERGAALKAHCEGKLEAARLRVEKIVVGPGGVTAKIRGIQLTQSLAATAARVDAALDGLLPAGGRLAEAMRYAALAPGKRLRPYFLIETARLLGAEGAGVVRAAAALELIHAYSLVHDDLPCMDDDDLRRGRPTTHKAFDEATAVLAGDALQTLAFEILAGPETHADGAVRAQLVLILARASGQAGMAGGQMLDLAGDADIERMQALKTGALILAAFELAAALAGAKGRVRDALLAFGRDLGVAYQIADDLLDAEGDAATLGKQAGKDAAKGKANWVTTLGAGAARRKLADLQISAVSHLEIVGFGATSLRDALQFVLERKA